MPRKRTADGLPQLPRRGIKSRRRSLRDVRDNRDGGLPGLKLARYYRDGCGQTFWTAVITDPQKESYKCVRCCEDAPFVRTDVFDDLCHCHKTRKVRMSA